MEIIGKHLKLRLVEIDDAQFILDLRNDDSLNKYLSKTDSSLENQKKWIENYKIREKENKEFYFIIEKNKENKKLGVVRLYNFIGDSFEWGSWIIHKGAPIYTALESALLIYELAFFNLKFEKSHFEVVKDNEKVISFHLKFGVIHSSEDEEKNYYDYSKDKYLDFRKKYIEKYIEGVKNEKI